MFFNRVPEGGLGSLVVYHNTKANVILVYNLESSTMRRMNTFFAAFSAREKFVTKAGMNLRPVLTFSPAFGPEQKRYFTSSRLSKFDEFVCRRIIQDHDFFQIHGPLGSGKTTRRMHICDQLRNEGLFVVE